MIATLTKLYFMKHLTNKTNQLFIASILILSSLFFFSPPIIAEDLIEVVLDDNLDFATNNGNLQPTKIYEEFDMSVNFTNVNLFDLSVNDFPINIDGYFDNNSAHVKLKISQSDFSNIKQNRPEHVLIDIPVVNGKKFTLALSQSNPLSDDFQFKDTNGNPKTYNEGLHYHGIVKDNKTSWAAVSIFDDYVRALFIDYEGIYILSAVNHFEEHYLLYNDKKLAVPYYSSLSCGVDEMSLPGTFGAAKTEGQLNYRSSKKMNSSPIRISIETDYSMFVHQQNFQNVYNYVSATLNEAAILFENDNINITLSELIAWNQESIYDKNSTSTVLRQLADSRIDDFNGDLLHLFTSEYLDRGGLASVSGLGKCYTYYPDYDIVHGPYGLSVVDFWPCAFGLFHYDVWTFVHEIGHNLGSRHTDYPAWIVNGEPNQPLDNIYNYQTELYCFDDQSNDPCHDHEVPDSVLYKTGGSIMSYFVISPYGVSFYRGFGNQPEELILSKVDHFLNRGCTDDSACNYNPNATYEDGSCQYGNKPNDSSIFDKFPWLNGKINKDMCTNESIVVYQYENYEYVIINRDNCLFYYNCTGSLLFEPGLENIEITDTWTCRDCSGNIRGCKNTSACNYNPNATVSDGSCNFGDNTCADPCDCNCLDIKVSNNVFERYPWLADSINYEGNYFFEKITEYDFNSYQYIQIEYADGTSKLFRENGLKYCDRNYCQGQWYYLIETTDGEILDPYNDVYNINFEYPNGAVVNFSYIEEFPSNCEHADKGVQINCIQIDESYACNYSNTGTVIYRNCDDGLGYYLIEMDDGRIFDPYNSSAVNFDYVVGDVVQFEYLPYTQTYCNLSDEAGIVTCIRSIVCNNTGIVFFENCNSTNYLIQTTNGTVIHPVDQSGTGYNFQNGDIVQFGYSSTFTSSCTEAAYGVYLTCIQPIELPCTHTGEVISEECNGVAYTLIDMGNGNILDPYLSPIVNFEYVEGDFVEFAYMPFSFSACSAALESGIITCIKNTCRNNVRIINSVPIPNGTNGNAKHIITYGEVHQSSNVVLKAPRITLDVGFKVNAGAAFKTINEGCD